MVNNMITEPYAGMTLRDYFAAQVMQGLCASGLSLQWSGIQLSESAYFIADEMIKERYK